MINYFIFILQLLIYFLISFEKIEVNGSKKKMRVACCHFQGSFTLVH